MGKITRKNVDYFEMFETGMNISLEAAKKLRTAFADGKIDETELRLVKEIEHKGDIHVHECLKLIEIAFITPIDRTDLVEIIKAIENLTDSIDYVANHINIFNVKEADEYLFKFVDYVVLSCEKLSELMVALKQFKKNQDKISECIIEVNRLEEEGDRAYSASMKNLFMNETNPVEIIKKKELYQLLEQSLDCCEEIADLTENVLVAKT